jgi:light-regulated signal transduction histidine kinase (bacteriophytochrome)
MNAENTKPNRNNSLLNRLQKSRPEFKRYSFDLATDLHERLESLQTEIGLTKEQVNDALNYATRGLITRLEREAKQAKK